MDTDQLASQKPSDLDLHCFQNGIYLSESSMVRVKLSPNQSETAYENENMINALKFQTLIT